MSVLIKAIFQGLKFSSKGSGLGLNKRQKETLGKLNYLCLGIMFSFLEDLL